MAKATKTINPLPFDALEPKRFEDLVRQVAYSFRTWKSLEATGVSGNDSGIDIRGIETRNQVEATPEETESNDSVAVPQSKDERVWVFQCKREKSITPGKLRKILEDFFKQNEEIPYGYVLAAACNFSSNAREVFRTILKEKGVEEFFLWGKTDLEDMLFQPKNDHLLFAYFGISLQVRKRTLKTQLTSTLSTKRKLIQVIGDVRHELNVWVLLRDPTDSAYPFYPEGPNGKGGRWGYSNCIGHLFPETLVFKRKLHFAYISPDKKSYDVFDDLNLLFRGEKLAYGYPNNYEEKDKKEYNYRKFWKENVPGDSKAYITAYAHLKYESILLVDEFGDHYNESPHLLITTKNGNPWDFEYSEISLESSSETFSARSLIRTDYFPKKMALEERPVETMETLRQKLEDKQRLP